MKVIEKCYIYILTSPSGKKYVGQTVNIEKRFENYRNLRRFSQIKLSEAITKYGWNSFNKEVIEYNNITQKKLDDLEIEYIRELNSYNLGYNCTIGGGGKRSYYTEEEKNKAKKLNYKRYRERNKTKIKKSNNDYCSSKKGKEKTKIRNANYYLVNKEKISIRNKEYIVNNKKSIWKDESDIIYRIKKKKMPDAENITERKN